jgi:hypothetical protein
MFRIAALNAGLGGLEGDNGEEECFGVNTGPSREILESTAHSCHSAAIVHLAKSENDEAMENLLDVLANPYVANVRLVFYYTFTYKSAHSEVTHLH